MTTNQDVHESIRPLLELSREMISRSLKLDYALISSLDGFLRHLDEWPPCHILKELRGLGRSYSEDGEVRKFLVGGLLSNLNHADLRKPSRCSKPK
jgi:hypothetical protein